MKAVEGMETKSGVLRERTAALLDAAGVKKRYVGYGYLLDAADLLEGGAKPGPMLLKQVAVKNHRSYTQVRGGILRVIRSLPEGALRTRPPEREPETDPLWDFLGMLYGMDAI